MEHKEITSKQEKNNGEIVLYQPDETIRLEVRLYDETVWLTQAQMALLFGRDRSVISKHIINCFKEKELVAEEVCAKFAHTTIHGAQKGKTQEHDVLLYNLDVIISVGYRIKSQRGTRFRQWATRVLKRYILQGAAINKQIHFIKEEIDNRLARHDQQIQSLSEKVDFFVQSNHQPLQGIFFDGQVFDAYQFISDLIRKAQKTIVLIDNYVDDTVLTILDKRSEGVSATIYTKRISQQFQLDLDKHNKSIDVRQFNKAHDRFLMIDDEVYHIGASIKDLGKKWFAFTLMRDITTKELIGKMAQGDCP